MWGVLVGALTIVGGLMFASGGFQHARAMQAVSLGQFEESRVAPQWFAIVIHASGTPAASVEALDRSSQALGLDSMPFHFVIGNGLDAPDGSVVAGRRWTEQRAGSGTAQRPDGSQPDSAWFDEHAIAICLAGNGDRRPFTEAQLDALIRSVKELQRLHGIPDSAVYLHADLSPVSDPGVHFAREQFFAALAT